MSNASPSPHPLPRLAEVNPPVSSRTIRGRRHGDFRLQRRGVLEARPDAGRARFAKTPSPLQARAARPPAVLRRQMIESGSPTAPISAPAWPHASSVGRQRGRPARSAAPPISFVRVDRVTEGRGDGASTSPADATTSGPTPSPGIRAIENDVNRGCGSWTWIDRGYDCDSVDDFAIHNPQSQSALRHTPCRIRPLRAWPLPVSETAVAGGGVVGDPRRFARARRPTRSSAVGQRDHAPVEPISSRRENSTPTAACDAGPRAGRVLPEHQRRGRHADVLGAHDLVGPAILQHAVLVDAGFVRNALRPTMALSAWTARR